MELSRLSIRQTYGAIGIESQRAQMKMESPPGELRIESTPAAMDVQRVPAELNIDSSEAWMAYGKGNHLEWYRMVSSQYYGEFLNNVARIVEEGNQLAQFTKPGNTIANIMANRIVEKPNIQYVGEASTDNVDLQYIPASLNINWNDHETQIEYLPQKPQVTFEAAVTNIYMRNKNSIEMWVSNYNLYG
ncbi:DUF6470 family protein [Paenibacillus lentus]|uniref:Uncharacterized protein n=1 Tax=Paenibacillus lentus TaxID=1338368 RepID=A0A3Q8S475_9BACL|nr:DUF6470 family protein [Paenibacillus lentus]AZK45910.1 hypothetical protein EIM92_06590 [Paenibacillus lentus]